MQYVGLGQQGFYEPFFYLGNRLAQTREFNLNKEKFEFAKSQEAPLNLATIGQKTAETGLLKSLQTVADRKAAAEALEAENKAKASGIGIPLQEARAKAGKEMFQNMLAPPGILPPEIPGGGEAAPAPEWRIPMKLQEPGSSKSPPSPTPTQAPGLRVPLRLPAPGASNEVAPTQTIPYRPPTPAGTPQTRLVMGKDGMPEFQNIEGGLTIPESYGVAEAMASPTGKSAIIDALPENRREQIQKAIDLRRLALVGQGEQSRVRSEKAKAAQSELELAYGTPSERARAVTEERALKSIYKNLGLLRDTVAGPAGNWETSMPFLSGDPKAAAVLANVPTYIAEDLTKLMSNPEAGTQAAVTKLYTNIPMGLWTKDATTLEAIKLQEERVLDWVSSIENSPATKRPFVALDPEMRAKVGPTLAYTDQWKEYDRLVQENAAKSDTAGTVSMRDPKTGGLFDVYKSGVEKQLAKGWKLADDPNSKGVLPPVQRKGAGIKRPSTN